MSALEELLVLKEKINSLEKNIAENSKQLNDTVSKLDAKINNSITYQLSIEESLKALGGLLTAIAKVLTKKNILDSEEVMVTIRQQHDDSERGQIKVGLEAHTIVPTECADSNSVVVLKQGTADKNTDQYVKILSEYKIVDLTSETGDVSQIIGKRVGDVIKLELQEPNLYSRNEIIEIYTYNTDYQSPQAPINN